MTVLALHLFRIILNKCKANIMDNKHKDLILNGSLTHVMWKLSIPAIAAMVLFGLNTFMDTVYIGQFMSETALAGVSIAYPLTSLLLGIGSWAGTGAANRLSIALGEDDFETQKKILPNAVLFGLMVTVLLVLPAYIFAEDLIQMMGGKGDILNYGVDYFKTTLLVSPLWVYGLTINMIVRGEGRMKTAALMMTYGLIVNLILTPIFLAYFDWGVKGAAWATNIGMTIYAVVGYFYFRLKKSSFLTDANSLKFNQPIFKTIITMGLPGFIMSVMSLLQAFVVFNAIVNYGTEHDLAFFAGANRFLMFLMTPLFGLMRALQPIAGINFGAQRYNRVKESFLLFTKTGMLIVLPFWLLLTIFPESSMRLMLPTMDMSAEDFTNLRIFMLVLPSLPLVFMSLTFLPAVKEEKYGSIIGLARQFVFYVPVMLILPRIWGIDWVYIGSTIIDLIITVWILLIIRKVFKKLDFALSEVA